MFVLKNDLEYDPALYQRDRGELDWDARSMASTTLDGASFMPPGSKGNFYASSSQQNLLPGYDRYLNQGPGNTSEIELGPIDSPQEPLLSPRSQYYQMQASQSQQSLPMRPMPRRQDSSYTYRDDPAHTQNHGTPPSAFAMPPRQMAMDRSGSPFGRPPSSMRSESPHMRGPSAGQGSSGRGSPQFDPYAAAATPPQAYSSPQAPQRQFSRDPYGAYPPPQQQSGDQNFAGRGAHKGY
jgi:calcium permeable stress-gated cation channel